LVGPGEPVEQRNASVRPERSAWRWLFAGSAIEGRCERPVRGTQLELALVWHGSGLLVRSAHSERESDFKQAGILFQNGLEEMDRAVTLIPDRPSVLLPRAATLLSVSAAPLQPELARKLLQKAVHDYETVLALQAPYFAALPLHARGEPLSALADEWHRLEDEKKSREYHERIIKECPGSSYARNSEMCLHHQLPPNWRPSCHGCHTT
jgi:hypothetical protein